MPKIHRLWLFSWSMKPRGKMRKLSLSIFGGMIPRPAFGELERSFRPIPTAELCERLAGWR